MIWLRQGREGSLAGGAAGYDRRPASCAASPSAQRQCLHGELMLEKCIFRQDASEQSRSMKVVVVASRLALCDGGEHDWGERLSAPPGIRAVYN